MQILLLIKQPGQQMYTRLLVKTNVAVGTCVSLFAKRFGYPLVDSTGTPLTYCFLTTKTRQILPRHQSLENLNIHSGTCLLFDCVESQDETVLVEQVGNQFVPKPNLLTRRSALGTIASLALTGLGLGWFTGAATRVKAQVGAGTSAVPLPRAQHPSNQALRPLLHFTGHQQTIRSVAWSPDGEFLASGGDDAQVIVWTPDGLPHASIEHQAAVQTLAWSPEGSRLMSGSAHLVRFFTALTGNQLATHQHAGQVNSVAWSTHGHLLAVSASDDKRAIVWQTEEYLQQIVFTGHTAAILATTFSADGRTIASSSLGGVVRVWTAATGAELHPLYQDTLLPIPALAFAPSRTDLATGSTDGVMRLWNAFQCQAVRTSDQGPLCTDAPLRFQQTHGAIRTLAWSPDGRYLASGSDDGALALWDLVQSKTPVLSVLIQLYAAIHSIAWSPDSTSLVTAAGTTATIWHLDA